MDEVLHGVPTESLLPRSICVSEPSIHTIAKTIGEHKGRLRLRDERECAHRFERLPDRRKGGLDERKRAGNEYRVGNT